MAAFTDKQIDWRRIDVRAIVGDHGVAVIDLARSLGDAPLQTTQIRTSSRLCYGSDLNFAPILPTCYGCYGSRGGKGGYTSTEEG